MSLTRLIVNADDFGMSRGITDGIVAAHRYGFLTSASLMPNMPAAEYALERVAKYSSLGVGVHLNICAGRPILPSAEVRSLVGAGGCFYPPRVTIRRLCSGRARPGEILAEFRAQIRWMKERGAAPTHADSHHHMHLYPAAVLPFARALKAEGISCARAPRCTNWAAGARPKLSDRVGGPYGGSLARRIFVRAYRSALHLGAFRGLRMPAGRLAFHSFDRRDPETLGERWRAALLNPQPGTFELACHPGFFERGFSEADAIRAQREQELHWLTSIEMRQALERGGIALINYRHLAEEGDVQPASREAPALP